MKLYDWQGKAHEVTVEYSTELNGYDESYQAFGILIDGIRKLGGIAPIGWGQVERSAQYFLDGNHHPTHYDGKFSHLARVAA